MTFTDDLGRQVTVDHPQRVAVLIGSFADIWCLAGGKEQIVAAAGDTWTQFDLDLPDSVADLGGVKEMKKLPDAIFVVDPKKERICIQEAHTLGITLIGIADTNCDPEELDYVIPGNDDAIRAVKLIVAKMADAVIEANQGATGEEEIFEEAAVEAEEKDIEEVAEEA